MSTSLVMSGFYLMIIGMGTVFIFLIIMVIVMNLTYKLITFINKYYPEESIDEKLTSKQKNKSDDAEIALAIACAVKNRS